VSASANNPALLATLVARLRSKESLEIEFKRGKGGLPDDLWPTVSAFSNTNGGWLIVGVRETDGDFEAEGLKNPDLRLQDFFNQVRNPQKISTPVCGADDATLEELDGKKLLVIRVPAASRRHRPVFVGRNPYDGTYLRRNSGDYRCTKQEVDRMMREASDVAADSAILPGYTLGDLDLDAFTRYRRRYQTEDPGSPWNGYDDLRFLQALGAHRRDRQTGQEGLTVAGLLLFGTREALRDWRGRHLIDFRRLPEDGSEQERWSDRVAWEGHLFGAFETIYPRLVRDLPNPFRLREGVRRGEGPAQVAMREALVNLLVHADYSESQASLVFRHDQGCDFRNPGNSRVPSSDLLSGDRSDPRNPILVAAFRYIGLADEAGTGIPKILRAWREMGFNTPQIDVGTERYEFTLRLRYIHLLSDEDRAWLTALGDPEGEPRRLALVHAKEHGSVDNPQLCTLTGQHPSDATKTLTGLRDGGLLDSQGSGRGTFYRLSAQALAVLDDVRTAEPTPPHPDLFDVELGSPGSNEDSLGTKPTSLGTMDGSLGSKEPELPRPQGYPGTAEQWAELAHRAAGLRQRPRARKAEVEEVVADLCTRSALSLIELAELTGKSRVRVRNAVRALMEQRRLGYVIPETPSSPKQRYVAPPKPSP